MSRRSGAANGKVSAACCETEVQESVLFSVGGGGRATAMAGNKRAKNRGKCKSGFLFTQERLNPLVLLIDLWNVRKNVIVPLSLTTFWKENDKKKKNLKPVVFFFFPLPVTFVLRSFSTFVFRLCGDLYNGRRSGGQTCSKMRPREAETPDWPAGQRGEGGAGGI